VATSDAAVNTSTTAAQLSRLFGILIRYIADLLMMLQDYHNLAPNLHPILEVSYQEATQLQVLKD
jgi:E3 ubiquitin-protein ligase EDD1